MIEDAENIRLRRSVGLLWGIVFLLAFSLAWAWLRHQRTSALTHWFEPRFGHHTRARRIGIVALARKLLIALWRYADQGVLPDGAQVKG